MSSANVEAPSSAYIANTLEPHANIVIGNTKDLPAVITTTTTTATLSKLSLSSSSSSSPMPAATTLGSSPSTEANILNVADLSLSLQHFGIVDYLVFVLMLVVCAAIGFYFGFLEKKKKRNIEHRRGSEALDYLVGGRKMKVFPVSLSLVASFVSGISLLGTSTEIYVYGTQYAFILITLAISGVISWYIFLPVFCNLQLTSTYEYFEMRFGKGIRLFGSILFTVGTIVWLPIVVYVPALAFNQVTGINIHIVTPVVCIVCIFYTCVGGLKAVVWTDVIQTGIMLGAIIVVLVKGTIDVGGFDVVWQRNWDSGRIEAPAMTWDITERMSMFSIFVGSTMYFVQVHGCNQVIMQRYLSLPGLKEAKWAMIIFLVGVILLYIACFYNGLLIFARYHDCDPLSTKLAKAKDQLVPLLVMDILSAYPGMAGIFVAGVFSAALSSLSTGLNSLSAVFLEDYIKLFRKKPLTELQTAVIMRVTVLLTGALCVGLVFVVERLGTVLQLSITLGSITSGPLLGLFLMGLLMPWINGKSAFSGCIVSFIVMTWICIKGQFAIADKELVYAIKPVTTDGCKYHFDTSSLSSSMSNYTISLEESSKPFLQYVYHMSFLFYVVVGCLLSIFWSFVASCVFGRNDLKKYFEMRFDRRIRYFGSILFIFGMILYLPVAIYVPALTFNHVSGINVHVITPIVCTICTFYTCVGGLKAVIWTDVIQSFIMYGSVLAVCIKGTLDVGGLSVVLQRNYDSGRLNAPDWTWDPTVRLSVLSVLVGGTIHKIQSTDVNQISIQRFISLPSFQKAKQTVILYTLLLLFLLSSCCYMGLLAYATFHDCDPLSTKLAEKDDQLAPLLVMRALGDIPGLPGLFVAGVFSAALSSLSTGLNSLSCVITQDVIKPILREPLSEFQVAILLRVIVVVFGMGCMGLVFVVEKLGMVLQLASMTGAVSMGPLLGVYTMGVCLPWINGKSALTGSIVSFLATAWVCANAQIAQMNGEIRYPKLPVSVEGCTYTYDNATVWEVTKNYSPSINRSLYHLSFLWYTAFGAFICIVISAISTAIFGFTDLADLDPRLLAPFARRFLPKRRYTSVHLNDYFEKRFDRRLRLFGSVLFIVVMTLWMPISIYVPALTFNQVTGINVHVITPVLCVVCTIYTCIGGVKGVIWTDVLQSFIMVGSLLLVIIKGTIDVGGLDVVYQRNMDSGRITAPDMTLDPTVRMSILSVMIGGMIFKLQGICISQPAVQRFLSLPNIAAVKKTLIVFIVGLIFLLGLCMYLGLLAFAAFYDCDPITTRLTRAKDQVVPLYIMQIAGDLPGIPGLFVSGVFSAALSSLSTGLNSLSGVLLKDFVEPYRTKPLTEFQTAVILRAVVLIFGLAAIGMVHIVEHLGMVMQLSATVGSTASGPLLGIFTVGMMMPFVNSRSILTGCSVSSAVMAYVAIRAQFAIAAGELQFPIKPVSVEGCSYDFDETKLNSSIFTVPNNFEKGIHHMSFLWYTAVGAVMTIVVALLTTLYFGQQDTSEVDPALVVPYVRRFMKPRRYNSIILLSEKNETIKKFDSEKDIKGREIKA